MRRFLIMISAMVLLLCGCQEQGTDSSLPETTASEPPASSESPALIVSEEKPIEQEAEVLVFQEGGLGITYVVHSAEGNLMIDNGFYNEELEEYLKNNGGLSVVLITHGHYDHIGGIDELKQAFPDAEVYISEKDQALLTDVELNYSASMSEPVTINSEVQSLSGGTYDFAGYQVEVIPFGGHTAGSNFYYFPEENLLFTGDAVLPESLGPVRATGSSAEMQASVRALLARNFPSDMRVLCGHNGDTTYGELLESNRDLMENS